MYLFPPRLLARQPAFNFVCVWLTGEGGEGQRREGWMEGWQLLCRDANGREGARETRARSSGDEGGGRRTRVNYVGKRQHFQESRTFHSVRQQTICRGEGGGEPLLPDGMRSTWFLEETLFSTVPRPPFAHRTSNIPSSSMKFILKPWHGWRSIGVVVTA